MAKIIIGKERKRKKAIKANWAILNDRQAFAGLTSAKKAEMLRQAVCYLIKQQLKEEVADLQEKAGVSVLSSARKDVEQRTDEAIEKARDAVNEYLRPLTK